MENVKLQAELAEKLRKVAEDIRSLADSIQAVCADVPVGMLEEKPEAFPKPETKSEPKITLEKVRGILAEKSRSGHTAEVRAILRKFGADRLSDIDPKDYRAVLKEAEVL